MHPTKVAELRLMLAEARGEQLDALIQALASDARPGVLAAVGTARRKRARQLAEHERLTMMCAAEWRLLDAGVVAVAGVDEVGRGALAGPVTAGACVFPRDTVIEGLDDSKKLTPAARAAVSERIRAHARALAVAHASPEEIDALGIARATALAMRRAVDALDVPVAHVLVDGLPVDCGIASTAIVRGDSSVRAIAAAAVVAKVTRDALMAELAETYPGYGLAANKGYGSSDHLAALAVLGPSPIHRRSFAPCGQGQLF